MQGLYQWQLTGKNPDAIAAELAESRDFDRSDAALLPDALTGRDHAAELEVHITPSLDRKFRELSPVERGILFACGGTSSCASSRCLIAW